MLTPAVRFILIILGTGLGIALINQGNWMGAFPLLAAGLLAFGHFRYGTVWLAFRALRKGDMDRADALLEKVADPNRLNAQCRAYYDWIKGVVSTARGELDQARQHLESAVGGALRTSTDRSVALCCLAEVAAKSGDEDEAREILDSARAEPHAPSVDPIISKVESMMQKEV